MSDELILGIDAGTSMNKAVAFDLEGRQLAVAAQRNGYEEPGGGAVEQDMMRTWDDTARALRLLAEEVPDLARRSVALAVTGQGDGTWLIDEAGTPVAPAWLWLDSRAAGIVAEAEASGARAEMFRFTGCGLNACNQSAQLAWLKRHRPEVLEASATAFHCKDWLYFKLTGERATDPSEGSFTFGDFRSRSYRDEVLAALGIADLKRLLPEMLDGSGTTHPLTADAARATGLTPGLPVSLGCVDVVCTGLGAGLYDPQRAAGCSIVGSTGMHMRFFDDLGAIELPGVPGGYTMPFPVPGSVARMQSSMAATLNIDWMVQLACEAAAELGCEAEPKDALARLDARVLEAQAGAVLYHPYIHEAGERGPFVDVNARAQFLGLSTKVRFLDLLRGVYEGLALAARDCYGAMGDMPAEVRMAGGGARSTAMKRIFASALKVPIREVHREEAGAAGAAMMASVAIGAAADMAQAFRTWVAPSLGERIAPDAELTRQYERLYHLYVQARQTMPPLWQGLAAARQQEAPAP